MGQNTVVPTRLTVICGLNVQHYDDMGPISLGDLRKKLREVLNLTDDHKVVYVDGKTVNDPSFMLTGKEEVEFKKPAGEKGEQDLN